MHIHMEPILESLHQKDTKTIQDVNQYLKELNGEFKTSIYEKSTSRFKLKVTNPPRMTVDDLHQISILSGNIIGILIDLKRNEFTIDCWKEGCKKQTKKRRRPVEFDDIPTVKVDEEDRPQIEGVLQGLVGIVELEFTTSLEKNGRSYSMIISKLDLFMFNDLQAILKKFNAFITDTVIDFPTRSLRITVRKSDSNLVLQTRVRKRLRVE